MSFPCCKWTTEILNYQWQMSSEPGDVCVFFIHCLLGTIVNLYIRRSLSTYCNEAPLNHLSKAPFHLACPWLNMYYVTNRVLLGCAGFAHIFFRFFREYERRTLGPTSNLFSESQFHSVWQNMQVLAVHPICSVSPRFTLFHKYAVLAVHPISSVSPCFTLFHKICRSLQ